MITIHQLAEYVDALGDLSREAHPLDIAQEATALLDANLAHRFAMQYRAAAACDAHYLKGIPWLRVARACGKTPQTMANWMSSYGPRGYLMVAMMPSGVDTKFQPMSIDDARMRQRLADLKRRGWYAVPALRNAGDPDDPAKLRAGLSAEVLWAELSGDAE